MHTTPSTPFDTRRASNITSRSIPEGPRRSRAFAERSARLYPYYWKSARFEPGYWETACFVVAYCYACNLYCASSATMRATTCTSLRLLFVRFILKAQRLHSRRPAEACLALAVHAQLYSLGQGGCSRPRNLNTSIHIVRCTSLAL